MHLQATVLPLALGLFWPASGLAQSVTQLAGTGQAGITFTDNLYNAPEEPLPGEEEKESAWYLVLAPGVVLSHERRLSSYELTYTHSFFRYLTSVEADMHGDELEAVAAYRLTPLDDLTFSLSGSRASTATLITDPTAEGRPQPDAFGTYYTLTATQGFAHRFSRTWAGRQTGSFSVTTASGEDVAQGNRYVSNAAVGATYTLRHDAFGFDWTAAYYHSSRYRHDGFEVPRTRYLNTGPAASWMHNLDEHWSTSLNAGIGLSYQPDQLDNAEVESGTSLAPPTLGAGIHWQYRHYMATLAYAGTTRPDLLTNRVYYTDSVSMGAAWVVSPRRRVTLATNHIVSSNSSLVSPVEVNEEMEEPTTYTMSSSATLTWLPVGMLELGLHYVHAAELIDGTAEEASHRDFHRNQVTFTVGWQYPEFNLSRISRAASFRVSGGGGDDSDAAGASGEADSSGSSSSGGDSE